MFDRHGNRKYLNATELRAFLAALRKEPGKARRALCLTLFYTGCRVSEALNLTVRGADLSQKSVVFETLKQRKKGVFRSVPIPDNLVVLLGQILADATPEDKIWQLSRSTAYRIVKEVMRQSGITGAMACPKGLRHGFGVACVAKNIPLPTIKKWMGHAKLETTAIYLAVSGVEERNLASRLW